ncbi:MAG: DUF389 domain-containing protein [Deltaproteobacteria bacterium]|nr:DUF389 domain-containing protein [Deltaproteobacteria bacterium]
MIKKLVIMHVRRRLEGMQDGIARQLGLGAEKRTVLLRTMLHRSTGDAAGYWLQLMIAAALATLGLALDSTAVVIGAMLIAPLMRPIMELAMGLATGSPPLVFRTGIRTVASILAVVLASATITWLLPFHEPTRELLARTAPSLLDLFVAGACAVAGAYAVITSSNDVAATAAGTSIGISLVPPLCTAGYGLSVRDWEMAQGAALLFTANVTGIITVAGVAFLLTGFGRVDVRGEERALDEDVDIGVATRVGRMLSRRASKGKLGMLPRIVLPFALLAAIAVPLQSAVGEMARRSAVRQRIGELLAHADQHRIVQYALDQTARPPALRVVLVGDPKGARALELHLRGQLAALGEPTAHVVVWAVPDAAAFSALTARLDDLPLEVPPPAPAPQPPTLHARLEALWPAQAGPLVGTWISSGAPTRLRVTHLGQELGPAGRELLARSLTIDGERPEVEDHALLPLAAPIGEEARWLPAALQLIERTNDLASIYLCVSVPTIPTIPTVQTKQAKPVVRTETVLARASVMSALTGRPNTTVEEGAEWSIAANLTPCTPAAALTETTGPPAAPPTTAPRHP